MMKGGESKLSLKNYKDNKVNALNNHKNVRPKMEEVLFKMKKVLIKMGKVKIKMEKIHSQTEKATIREKSPERWTQIPQTQRKKKMKNLRRRRCKNKKENPNQIKPIILKGLPHSGFLFIGLSSP